MLDYMGLLCDAHPLLHLNYSNAEVFKDDFFEKILEVIYNYLLNIICITLTNSKLNLILF